MFLQPWGLARCSQLLTVRIEYVRTFDIDSIETTYAGGQYVGLGSLMAVAGIGWLGARIKHVDNCLFDWSSLAV